MIIFVHELIDNNYYLRRLMVFNIILDESHLGGNV